MKKGICVAGDMLVDITYPIERWPAQSELTHITEGIARSTGGAVCNTIVDLARLDASLPLYASGLAGRDADGDFMLAQLAAFPNIDLSGVRREGRTSFTAVMSNNETKERTFFQYIGANALYDESSVDLETLSADLFHIGYILLLPRLDEPDAEYGTRMARLLAKVKSRGIRTSIDVVTEAGSRFAALVTPALRYTDYCVINELEAQQTTGVLLRDGDGRLHTENMEKALRRLRELGVGIWAVIHCPEGGFGLDENGAFVCQASLSLPQGYIRGTVGAGDAFCAGVLYCAETGGTLGEALRLGVCTAAASLAQPGASEGVRPAAETLALYEAHPPHPGGLG